MRARPHCHRQLLLGAPDLDVNATDNDGRTALLRASQEGHATIVESLLAAPGLDVNAAGNNGHGPALCSCSWQRHHADAAGRL